MNTVESQLPLLILVLPLIGFLINGTVTPLLFRGFSKAHGPIPGVIATGFIGCAFALAVQSALAVGADPSPLSSLPFEWIAIGDLHIRFQLNIDRLSSLLTLIITGVGTLIHVYSIGYMSHEHGVNRYFAYLNLFCFSMLLLVLGANLPLLFFGWEGVGLCSYLLIGYWYEDPAKASAGKKAFIVNRVGDLGFLVGMFILFAAFRTLDFSELAKAVPGGQTSLLTAAAIALFVGATGKSAQIPLYVWLPDAMAGPTPVSALIHAATMVTAGVYMIARLNFMFELAPEALSLVAHIGGLTAFFAATIAIAQNDIKKVLAYSTVSQLGYMFLAAGVGNYVAAVFHLMTHAFFKALLFLGSGSVIHACEGEQDMRKMGGLQKHMPITFATMAVGTAAIAGVPFFSGFFSKDEILYSTIALPGGATHLYILGLVTAGLTAVYMTRMMVMTFFGKARGGGHPHESPLTMTVPLIILAVLAALGGFLGVPHLLGHAVGLGHGLEHWLSAVIPEKELPSVGVVLGIHEGLSMLISVAIACGGIFLGYKIFLQRNLPANQPVVKLLEHKYYIDELYELIITKPLQWVATFFWKTVDVLMIDALVLGVAKGARRSGQTLRTIQTGDVRSVALMIGFGLVLLLAAMSFWVIR
jgi:NADH-quinone oxidoreductase subunit L